MEYYSNIHMGQPTDNIYIYTYCNPFTIYYGISHWMGTCDHPGYETFVGSSKEGRTDTSSLWGIYIEI